MIEIGFLDGFAPVAEAAAEETSRGQALASLLASDLRERFYSWRGVSGRRYICSIFSAADAAVVSEFTAAAVIGVSKIGEARRPVCVMSSREYHVLGNIGSREGLETHSVTEWHVHFCADDEAVRDLAGALLS